MFDSASFWILLIAYVALAPLLSFILGVVAFRRTTALGLEVASMRMRGQTAAPMQEEQEVQEEPEPESQEELPLAQPEEGDISEEGLEFAGPPPLEEEPEAVEEPQESVSPPKLLSPGWEQRIASRWMLWLGGMALALGGGFLVKVSIEMGLLGPGLRCFLGALLGLALAIGGEVLRRRPLQIKLAEIAPNYLPSAISAAGIAILFASIYAAHGLYGFFPALIAFALLGAVAFSAVGLALLQGPLIAALGLLGGFITPIVLESGKPSALALFGFLLALTCASLAIARYRRWEWLAVIALSGANLWATLWAGAIWQAGSVPVYSFYLLSLAVATIWFRHGLLVIPKPHQIQDSGRRWPKIDALVTLAIAGLLLNTFFFIRLEHYGVWSLSTLAILVAFALFHGRRSAHLFLLPGVAAAAVLFVLATWHLPQFVPGAEPLISMESSVLPHPRTPIVPPVFLTFTLVSMGFALLFGACGYLFRQGARMPGAWASFSALLPLAIFVVAYWRIEHFEASLPWAVASLVLAGLFLVAAVRCDKQGEVMRGALGAYAVATTAAIALAATMELREAWLTVALSLMLPVIAWIDERLDLKALRLTAGLIAGGVIIRLLFNQALLSGSPIGDPLFNWLLYGYGVPAVAFIWAARLFRPRASDILISIFEAGAVLFTTLLVTFEIRSFFQGGVIGYGSFNFVEQATQILGWLGLAIGLFWINRKRARPVFTISWRLLGGLALLCLAFGPLTFKNPIWHPVAVGDWYFWNLLALGYLAPALLLGFGAWLLRRFGEESTGTRIAWITAGLSSLLLLFAWSSLELRHAFHGSVMAYGGVGDGEWYAYSLLWLIEAAALLVLGIRLDNKALRHIGMTLLSLVILKVFLSDMAALEGLYRAFSFLGLGASLIGIGYVYQRFLFVPKPTPADESSSEADESA